jgi:diphosphomevalonate decarboxylase
MNQTTWRSPSNIALIKYWGKKGNQLPMNPSLSFSLDKAFTETTIIFSGGTDSNKVDVSLTFEGHKNKHFEDRIAKFVNSISEYIPSLKGLRLEIDSYNSFPHSSGIASSASSMSALALGLVSIEHKLLGQITHFSDFQQKASFIARLGSGSAARSVYGGYSVWGATPDNSLFSNEYAMDINDLIHPVFKTYGDAILLVTNKEKKVSSTVGHQLMESHPFADSKFTESFKNMELMLEVMKKGEQQDFALLTELEALSLHAMMMTSNPSFLLMEPQTLSIINKIRDFRLQTGLPVCFTLDAGANVHFIYPDKDVKLVKSFIESELLPYCVQKQWIDDKVGLGPVRLT